MYYKFEQLLLFSNIKGSFYKRGYMEISHELKTLPSDLAFKVIYSEIAEALSQTDPDQEKTTQIASVAAEYGIKIPKSLEAIKKNINKYLDDDALTLERSIDLLTKSAELEEGIVDIIEVSSEGFEFLKEDFLEREKYELINKMKIKD